MHEFDSTPKPDADSLAEFEHRLRALEPRPANFDIASVEHAALGLANQNTSLASPVAKSNWTTIFASWSTGAAAGILGTLLSFNLFAPAESIESAKVKPQDNVDNVTDSRLQSITSDVAPDIEQSSPNFAGSAGGSSFVPSSDFASPPSANADWLLELGGLSRERTSVLTPRMTALPFVGTGRVAAGGQYRFSSVTLLSPIRPEPKREMTPRNANVSAADSAIPERSDAPNQRELLMDMLDPFTST